MGAVVLVVCDGGRTRFGLRSRLGEQVGGVSVLERTVRRALGVGGADRVVLVHPRGERVGELIGESVRARVSFFEWNRPEDVASGRDRLAAARKWALDGWRGGLGDASVYDELLPADPLAAALGHFQADAALVVGGSWCFFDAALGTEQLRMHVEHPEAYKVVFTQAPPGLSGVATGQAVLSELAEHGASFASALGYNPRYPKADPVGKDVNVPVAASVRDAFWRFVYDTPRAAERMQRIVAALGEGVDGADAEAVTEAARRTEGVAERLAERLPQQVTLELTPRRPVDGPIVPQHYVGFERGELSVEQARRIFAELGDEGACGDAVVRLGGLGDALLHPECEAIVEAAREAGVMGIALETDLLVERELVQRVAGWGVDVVSVRLNADTAATYERVMGRDAYRQVLENLQALFSARREGMPWIVPRLMKTEQTLGDMETFFDRWTALAGHAVIEPAQSGAGLMPELSPVPMAPPKRQACRQLGRRLTILSDGRIALCDQDWQGRASLGGDDVGRPLLERWGEVVEAVRAHEAGAWDGVGVCGGCGEWFRP